MELDTMPGRREETLMLVLAGFDVAAVLGRPLLYVRFLQKSLDKSIALYCRRRWWSRITVNLSGDKLHVMGSQIYEV